MRLYRLTQRQFADDFSGKGAELYGGRWNSVGTKMIYTAESRALCVAEMAVHLNMVMMRVQYAMVTYEFDEQEMPILYEVKQLPKDWDVFPHAQSTQSVGDRFVAEDRYAILKVPSAVVAGEYNFLINPTHQAAKNIKVESIVDFRIDPRLAK